MFMIAFTAKAGTQVRRVKLQGTSATPYIKSRRTQTEVTKDYGPIPQKAKLCQTKSLSLNDSQPDFSEEPSQVGMMSQGGNSSSSSDGDSSTSQPSTPSKGNPKNVKLRLREDNSYEFVAAAAAAASSNGLTAEDHKIASSGEMAELLSENSINNDNFQEKLSLETFQQRQKMMEEQNKKRREMLAKAIADRKKQTQSEAKKLQQIQAELTKLDNLLSSDVSILRDQIEAASVEFNEAQKRYDKAEKEFIEAKLSLFHRLERKELLTEHLCRIIEANEQRKANKLSELMAKLEMVDVSVEGLENGVVEVLPQLATLDEVTYAACTTIRNPRKASVGSSASSSVPSTPVQISSTEEPKSHAALGTAPDPDIPVPAQLVLAVVIGVVVAQQQGVERRTRGRRLRQQAPVPLPASIQGAGLAPERRGRVRRPVAPAPTLPQVRIRPGSARFAPQAEQPISVRAPPPPPPSVRRPAPIPPPAPPPPQDILDFDYIDYDVVQEDKATTLDRSPLFESPLRQAPEPVRAAPPRSAPRPPPPPPRAPAPIPRPAPAPAPAPAPRPSRPRSSAPLSNIEVEFNLDPNREPIRGLREPDVQIVKSWSHSNPDGTFSWGYLDSSGTFKNETRGLDCVVRGTYGYYDDKTGEPLQFNYQSGNPCDPDATKDYYDYDLLGFPVTESERPRGRDRQG
ncbi:uncharacterized protein LOC143024683 isoform X2 [Oratosquilla oratoria]|uniref:uncharacterized protein LOC143024683 isoform X2 n=1 Tax=Oratosquilla oratoria TaxID=337810 RepID=UPI003F773375